MNETNIVCPKIDRLIDGWCERRALKPLRFILRSHPLFALAAVYNGAPHHVFTAADFVHIPLQ